MACVILNVNLKEMPEKQETGFIPQLIHRWGGHINKQGKKWDLGNNHLDKGTLASGPRLNTRDGLLEHRCSHVFLCCMGSAQCGRGEWCRVGPTGSRVHHLATPLQTNPWSRSLDNPLLKMSRKAELLCTLDAHVGWYLQPPWEDGIPRRAQGLGPFSPQAEPLGWRGTDVQGSEGFCISPAEQGDVEVTSWLKWLPPPSCDPAQPWKPDTWLSKKKKYPWERRQCLPKTQITSTASFQV